MYKLPLLCFLREAKGTWIEILLLNFVCHCLMGTRSIFTVKMCIALEYY